MGAVEIITCNFEKNTNSVSVLVALKVAAALPRDSACLLLINASLLVHKGKSYRSCCLSLQK